MNRSLAHAAVHQAGAAFWPASEGMHAGWMIPAEKPSPIAMVGAVTKRWYATAGGLMAQTGQDAGASSPGGGKPPAQVQPTITPMMLGAGGGTFLLVKLLGAPLLAAAAAGALVAGTMLFTAGAIVQSVKGPKAPGKGGQVPAPGGTTPGTPGMPVPGGTGMPLHGAPGAVPGGVGMPPPHVPLPPHPI